MVKLWKVTCCDGAEEKWTREVSLSDQDMHALLKMLLSRCLEPDEIIDSVLEKRNLLEVRALEHGGLWTSQGGLLHYTAEMMQRP